MTQTPEVRNPDSLAFHFSVTAHSYSPNIYGTRSKFRRADTEVSPAVFCIAVKRIIHRLTFFLAKEKE